MEHNVNVHKCDEMENQPEERVHTTHAHTNTYTDIHTRKTDNYHLNIFTNKKSVLIELGQQHLIDKDKYKRHSSIWD